MTNIYSDALRFSDPEILASDYLNAFYNATPISFPISPFEMLNYERVTFVLRNFKKLEGVYIPAKGEDDVPIVSINAHRPITRQRFTAAHELCHHLKDSDNQIACAIGARDASEKFADAFASALLMPMCELRKKVNQYSDENGNVSLESVLHIADYFGVSFESCLYRIAYKIHAIDGDTSPDSLKKRIKKFKPDNVRKMLGLTYLDLYCDLVDNYAEQLRFTPNDNARYLFEHEYIYNDSRMEGADVTIEEASEIVTDLRLNAQNSTYCNEEHEAYMSIAGHYKMYQSIFESPTKDTLSIYDTFLLNRDLFSYYPCPEFGGNPRQQNVLVLGAKFEAVDFRDIYPELAKIDVEIKSFFEKRHELKPSEYIMHIARVHHRITVIHPFPEGNGRTSRAFMNMQLVRSELSPIYIKVEEKDEYISALELADKEGNYTNLYEIIFKVMIRVHAEMYSSNAST